MQDLFNELEKEEKKIHQKMFLLKRCVWLSSLIMHRTLKCRHFEMISRYVSHIIPIEMGLLLLSLSFDLICCSYCLLLFFFYRVRHIILLWVSYRIPHNMWISLSSLLFNLLYCSYHLLLFSFCFLYVHTLLSQWWSRHLALLIATAKTTICMPTFIPKRKERKTVTTLLC